MSEYEPSQRYRHDGLAESNLHFVQVGDHTTRYYDAGSGEPIVLFHGGHFGSLYSLDSFSLNLPGLSQRTRVVAFDKLGQGFTDGPTDVPCFTYEAVVAHARAAVDALGLDGMHLVGHSRGGLLVASLAYELGDRVRSVTIVNSGTLAPDNPDAPPGAFYAALPSPDGDPTAGSVQVEPLAQAYEREHVTTDFVRRLLEIARRPATLAIQADIRGRGGVVFGASLTAARRDMLALIRCDGLPVPTLVIWGRNDRSAPPSSAHALYEIICAKTAEAELHIFNQSGHYTFREHPESFNDVLVSFCERSRSA